MSTFLRAASFAIVAGLVVTANANPPAPLPVTQEAVYHVHSDPNEPNSPVVFSYHMELTQAARNGEDAGWYIERIRFHDPYAAGNDTWTEDDPAVDTADGLWWISHADASQPALAEFTELPPMSGLATADDGESDGLEYALVGDVHPAGEGPWAVSGVVDYFYFAPEEPLEGGDEWVEVEEVVTW